MKEEFKSDALRDWNQRFSDTFGWFTKSDGSDILVKVVGVVGERLQFVDAQDFPYYANADAGNIFSFIPLEKGCYNYNDDVVFCRRIPARQWKRGICAANTRVTSLATGRNKDIDFGLIKMLFAPVKESKNIERFCKTRNTDAALTSAIAVADSNVYVYDYCVGQIKNKESIVLRNSLFVQEIQDVVIDLHLNMTVEVEA